MEIQPHTSTICSTEAISPTYKLKEKKDTRPIHCLTIDKTIEQLKHRKVKVWKANNIKRCITKDRCGGCLTLTAISTCVVGTMALMTAIGFNTAVIAYDRTGKQEKARNLAWSNVIWGPALGLSLVCCLSSLLIISCYYGTINVAARSQKRRNQLIDCKLTMIEAQGEGSDPLNARSFCKIFNELKFEHKVEICTKLNFQQISDIGKVDETIYNKLLTENLLRNRQKAPWATIEMIKKGSNDDIIKALNEDYVTKLIKNKQGFLEELVRSIPEDVFSDREFQEILASKSKKFFKENIEGKITKEDIINLLEFIREGNELEDIHELGSSDKVELSFGLGRSILVSKETLINSSDYFRAIYDEQGPSEWSESSHLKFHLENISEKTFEVLEQYFYNRKQIKINSKNFHDIFEAASYYGFNELKQLCRPYIKIFINKFYEKSEKFNKKPQGLFILKEHKTYLTALYYAQNLPDKSMYDNLLDSLDNEIGRWATSYVQGSLENNNFDASVQTYSNLIHETGMKNKRLINGINTRIRQRPEELVRLVNLMSQKPSPIMLRALIKIFKDSHWESVVRSQYLSTEDILNELRWIRDNNKV
jgi:hypothetical protein